jgi:uncharacterized membrane protein YbhN (UPF0104 family)
MKRALYWLGGLASVACAGFFVRAIAKHWDAVASIPWGSGVLAASTLALLTYVSTYAVAIGVWQQCLQALDRPLDYRRAAVVLMLSQFAKYLPGNIGHHVGRVALARNAGVPVDIAVASIVLETFLVVLAGAICSLPGLALLHIGVQQLNMAERTLPVSLLPVAVVGCLAAAGAMAWFWRRHILGRSFPLLRATRSLALASLGLYLSFALGGTALFLLCNALSATHAPWVSVVAVYAAAWLLGFLVPGSPAGVGVRELVLMLGLAPIYGASSATMAAALLRLITVAGDGLVFLLAVVAKARAPSVA